MNDHPKRESVMEAVREIEEHLMHLDMIGALSKTLFMELYDAAEEAVEELTDQQQREMLDNIVLFADPSWFGFDFSVPADPHPNAGPQEFPGGT